MGNLRIDRRSVASFLTLALLGACSVIEPSPPSAAAVGLKKAVWVSRFEYETADDIDRIMSNVARAGFGAVMFQVRGNGTVFYSAQQEVWSEVYGFAHPGFDPLQSAVSAAHAYGLELHAWINVMPGWRGDPQRSDPRQLLRKRPEWFVQDSAGQPMAQEANYYWLNPCLPDVRSYLSRLVFELAANYDVDGVHLDHIRFSDRGDLRTLFPADPATRAQFDREVGGTPESSPVAFEQWKTDKVTQCVQEIRGVLSTVSRPPVLSAAVWREPRSATQRFSQDWEAWTRAGLVDVVFPMNYEREYDAFSQNLAQELAAAGSAKVVVGIATYLHKEPEQTVAQIDRARADGADGVALYSYSSLFGIGQGDAGRAANAAFRRAVSGR